MQQAYDGPSAPPNFDTQGLSFDARARLDDVFDRAAVRDTNDQLRLQKMSGVLQQASRASRNSSALQLRVDNQLRENQLRGVGRAAPVAVPKALTGDQILKLYSNQTPSTYTATDGRLRILQEQADRDNAAPPQLQTLDIYTKLIDDLTNIHATDNWDYIRQMFDVLCSDNRPFFFGIVLVVFGLIGMALAPTTPPLQASGAAAAALPHVNSVGDSGGFLLGSDTNLL